MANAVNVNFRMDPDLKRSMEEVCAEMGLSMTTAFTICLLYTSPSPRDS